VLIDWDAKLKTELDQGGPHHRRHGGKGPKTENARGPKKGHPAIEAFWDPERLVKERSTACNLVSERPKQDRQQMVKGAPVRGSGQEAHTAKNVHEEQRRDQFLRGSVREIPMPTVRPG
jgi:hypothetical protein